MRHIAWKIPTLKPQQWVPWAFHELFRPPDDWWLKKLALAVLDLFLLELSRTLYTIRGLFSSLTYYFFVLQMISGLKTKRRILLTGTPVQVSPVLIFYLTTPSSKRVDLITRIFFSLNIVFLFHRMILKNFTRSSTCVIQKFLVSWLSYWCCRPCFYKMKKHDLFFFTSPRYSSFFSPIIRGADSPRTTTWCQWWGKTLGTNKS